MATTKLQAEYLGSPGLRIKLVGTSSTRKAPVERGNYVDSTEFVNGFSANSASAASLPLKLMRSAARQSPKP